MLAFFPTPYPDELLYSVIARYSQYLHYKEGEVIRNILFGSTAKNIRNMPPCGIDNLIRVLSPFSSLTADYLIREHTLYRLYAMLLNFRRRNDLYQIMKSPIEVTKDHTIVNFLTHITIVAPYMKYCPLCVAEDRKRYGETYWRRLFQLSEMTLCLNHNHPLLQSDVSCYTMTTYDEFYSAEQVIERPVRLPALGSICYPSTPRKTSTLEADWILQNDVMDTHNPAEHYDSVFLKWGLMD